MSNRLRLWNRTPETLEERYFSEIRPVLYKRHASHYQYGVRQGTTLAEHLDSACQFILTVSRIAGVPEDKRPILLAATAVHDLNKLDSSGRKLKALARDKKFLQEQLEQASVSSLVAGEEELELVRKLIERHSGHNVSDGARLLPEDPTIEQWAAMLIAADLFDLGIPEPERLRKVQTELRVALGRPSNLFKVCVSEDQGYITALLLGACEEVLVEYGLTPLAIFPEGTLFEGQTWPEGDLTTEVASCWQTKIDQVFGSNIDQLVKATKDGIKISPQAVQHDTEEVLVNVIALLEKKRAGFKLDKVQVDINKWGEGKVDPSAIANAAAVDLLPVTNADEFAISEGLKAAYLSYRKVEPELSPQQVWERIAPKVGLSEQQRSALEPFDAQYGRSLFAARAITTGFEGIKDAIRESLLLRKESVQKQRGVDVSEEMVEAVSRILNLPLVRSLNGINELNAYIDANPNKRCSLGPTCNETEDLSSMPPGTKVQVFSNRLPGGMTGEPRRQAEPLTSLAYQLMTVGACFPAVKNEPPFYLHLALPKGSCPELLRIWREFLMERAAINTDGGPVSVDEIKLYRDNVIEFKPNKVVGFAFPKRPQFLYGIVIIPIVWGDTNASVALLKSLRLALELSLSLDIGFPFTLSSSLEVELSSEFFGRVEGIPASLQPLLDSGRYNSPEAEKTGRYNRPDAEKIRERLRCLGQLALAVASIQKIDDCLYDLARAASRPIELYYVLLRWILREQDEPNLGHNWSRIRNPLNTLFENLMPNEDQDLTKYLQEAAQIAAVAKLWGSSYERTSSIEPFAAFISEIRSQKSHMPLDVLFAALVQKYHTRLDRIREHGVGLNKFEQLKHYYGVLRSLYEGVYQARPDKLLTDQKTLEAAYLFFLEEARQQLKNKPEDSATEVTASI